MLQEMKIFTPEISWHERDPIYSCAYHPVRKNVFSTAGVSGVIRLWEIKYNADKIEAEFLANLKRHTKAVNVIRWNHDGTIIASAGDEGVILLWNENDIKNQKTLDGDEDESKENWFAFKTLRGHLEDILDICWSRDGQLLISGSVDNSAIIWNISNGNKIAILKEPKGFVQGVTFDPIGNYYAVLSTDRSLRYYSSNSNKCIFNVNKMTITKENTEPKVVRLFHDDTMKSFYRRLCFSNDGNFIFVPSGCLEFDDKLINVSYIFTRNCLNKPCIYMPHDKPSNAIAVCPLKFQLVKHEISDEAEEKIENVFALPYRIIFAIATEDSILLYDTQHLTPFGYVTGIHYSNLTDLTWSNDGLFLGVTSIDGFCTFVAFQENELGEIYEGTLETNNENIELKPSNAQASTPKVDNSIKNLFQNIKNKTNKLENNENKIVEPPQQAKKQEDIDAIVVIPAEKKDEASSSSDKKSAARRIKLTPL